MFPKRSVRRTLRSYGLVAIKVLFLIGIAVSWVNDLFIQILWLRPIFEFLGRCLRYFDDWLRRRSLWFAFAVLGIFGALRFAIFAYKTYLLVHGQLGLLFAVEVAENSTFAVLVKHLLDVYRARLLTFVAIKAAYDTYVRIRTEAIAWVKESDWYREAISFKTWIVQEWATCKARFHDDWYRYSVVPLARRAARTERCRLLDWR